MSHSVTNEFSCAQREEIDQHLICVFNVVKVRSFQLDLCLAPSPGDDMVHNGTHRLKKCYQ